MMSIQSRARQQFRFSMRQLLRIVLYLSVFFAFLHAAGLWAGLGITITVATVLLVFFGMMWSAWLLHRLVGCPERNREGNDSFRLTKNAR